MSGSKAVFDAIRFLRDVHRDSAALLAAVDHEAQTRGFERTLVNRVSTDLSNGSDPEAWTIRYVSRLYVPRSAMNSRKPHAVVAFMICFEPEGHDQAIGLSVGATLKPTIAADRLWVSWADARPLLRYLADHPSGGLLPTQVLKEGFLPDAIEGTAHVGPLFELTEISVVRERLLAPAFAGAGI